jgi:hypothetical protein
MKRYARTAPLAAALWLAACASPLALTPGTPEPTVVSTLGRPHDVHALADGGRRLEYRIGALEQTKYMVDMDRDGRVAAVAQVHDFDRFMRLRAGVDAQADVRREFGQPRLVQRYSMSGLTAWLYPYREASAFNSEMAVYFDAQGKVVRVESGPDPRFTGGRNGKDD